MDRIKFIEAITTLQDIDSNKVEFILDSISSIEEVLNRPLTEDEKMIVYSSFITGYHMAILETELTPKLKYSLN